MFFHQFSLLFWIDSSTGHFGAHSNFLSKVGSSPIFARSCSRIDCFCYSSVAKYSGSKIGTSPISFFGISCGVLLVMLTMSSARRDACLRNDNNEPHLGAENGTVPMPRRRRGAHSELRFSRVGLVDPNLNFICFA